LQGTYARSLVAAAMAAAQDERAEMELHLTHARDLSARLETSAYPAAWPRPFDEAAGDLWLEVEEYAEALDAYQRAVLRNPQSSSWLGLARSAARLQETSRACEGYRQVMRVSSSAAEVQEAREYVARCP
jgi:tetratricopeptide (TPR) repeat protein